MEGCRYVLAMQSVITPEKVTDMAMYTSVTSTGKSSGAVRREP